MSWVPSGSSSKRRRCSREGRCPRTTPANRVCGRICRSIRLPTGSSRDGILCASGGGGGAHCLLGLLRWDLACVVKNDGPWRGQRLVEWPHSFACAPGVPHWPKCLLRGPTLLRREANRTRLSRAIVEPSG